MSVLPRLSGFIPDERIRALGSGVGVYVVGGAVRDELLGLPASDRDWVVTGATPRQMLDAGFTAVGADFPVFLHPLTHEEYALARTERKTAPGYAGFAFHAAPDVTLEEDLLRRDLSINAMAMNAAGDVLDPWGGWVDLQARRLRHVSPAFAEDPVRILRLARFAARFPDFSVDAATLRFCSDMVAAGEVAALVAERVWQEVARLLMAQAPACGWQVLLDCAALPVLLGADLAGPLSDLRPLHALPTCHGVVLLPARWAFWLSAAGLQADQAAHLTSVWRVPGECADLARHCVDHWQACARTGDASGMAAAFAGLDLYRRPDRFAMALQVMASVADFAARPFLLTVDQWQSVAATVRALPMANVAAQAGRDGVPVQQAVASARLACIRQALDALLK